MEYSKQSWDEVMKMPVKRMYDYIKWKVELEEEKSKLLNTDVPRR